MNKKARTRKFSAKQSARLGAYLSAGVAASMAASSEAEAAIVFFNVNPSQTITAGESVSFGNINLGTGTYTLNMAAMAAVMFSSFPTAPRSIRLQP
jgi:hypothetical protein